MNQEIDLAGIWYSINETVDWLWSGIIALVLANALFFLYFAWSVVSEPDFFKKYNVARSASFVAKAKSLKEVPAMEELEVEPPRIEETLPQRYVNLKETKMFIPLGSRQVQTPTQVADQKKEVKKKTLPKIEGYEIVGRIAGQGNESVSVLKRTRDGRTFIAKEGERLSKQTDIKVKNVTDTMVQLTQPQHRTTTFQFATDKIKEGIRQYRENVTLH